MLEHIYAIIFTMEKAFLWFRSLTKQDKVNNGPRGENSPNLVTLDASSRHVVSPGLPDSIKGWIKLINPGSAERRYQ
jgi:hypothetical protein